MNKSRNIRFGAALKTAYVFALVAASVFGQAPTQLSAITGSELMVPEIVAEPESPQNLALADAVQQGNFAVVQSLLARRQSRYYGGLEERAQ